MPLAPKDEHEAIQLFERGIPALLAVMGTQRLPFPCIVIDIVPCAWCRVPWHIEDRPMLSLWHNLHNYYDLWFKSESNRPFFYWLDVGDGKEIKLEKCPRSRLQRQCIKYLGPSNETEVFDPQITSIQ